VLFNAEHRLRSRQASKEVERETPFRKQTLAILGVIAVVLIFVYLFLLCCVQYDVSRYIPVFSATIQGVSAVFALVAAGTLLLVERISTHSPTSLAFLPKAWITGFFMIFIVIITLDIVIMLSLPSDLSWTWLINLVLVSNIVSVVSSGFYVKALLTWLQPETLFTILRKRGNKVKTKDEACEVINSVRELAMSAIRNRDSVNVADAIVSCESLSQAFCRRWAGERVGYDVEHPVRVVARCTEAIGLEAISADMDGIGHACIEALCSMASSHYDAQIHIDVWIFGSIQNITEALMKKKKGGGCIETLVMEAWVAINQDKWTLAHWLTCTFDELARIAGTWNNLDVARVLAIGLEILAETYSKKAAPTFTLQSFVKTVKVLEELAKDKRLGLYKGFFGERGWSRERTILDILKEAKELIKTASQKAFIPKEGDWPTPIR